MTSTFEFASPFWTAAETAGHISFCYIRHTEHFKVPDVPQKDILLWLKVNYHVSKLRNAFCILKSESNFINSHLKSSWPSVGAARLLFFFNRRIKLEWIYSKKQMSLVSLVVSIWSHHQRMRLWTKGEKKKKQLTIGVTSAHCTKSSF